jgi:hypothetical protein
MALYFMYYSFASVHQTPCVTPAMEAGLADQVWGIEEIVQLESPHAEDEGLQRPASLAIIPGL